LRIHSIFDTSSSWCSPQSYQLACLAPILVRSGPAVPPVL
jgi:hypothetical protein